jgi:preprotein translocase subunit SecD
VTTRNIDRSGSFRRAGSSWPGAVLAAVLLVLAACGQRENLQPWEVRRPADVSPSSVELRFAVDQVEPGAETLPEPDGKPLTLAGKPVVTRTDIVKVEVQRDLAEVYAERKDVSSVVPRSPPHYVISVFLTGEASRRLFQFSHDNIGRKLAIVVGGRILIAPVIMSALPLNLPFMIQGAFTREEAIHLAERLAP